MAYPSLPINNDSSRSPVNLGVTDITESGIIRQRDFTSVAVYEFSVTHTLLTQAEAESIVTNWAANKITAQSFDWVDGVTYTVRYKSPPVVKHQTGPYWSVSVTLIGSQT